MEGKRPSTHSLLAHQTQSQKRPVSGAPLSAEEQHASVHGLGLLVYEHATQEIMFLHVGLGIYDFLIKGAIASVLYSYTDEILKY